MTTVFVVIRTLAALAAGRERRLGHDPAPARRLRPTASPLLAVGRYAH